MPEIMESEVLYLCLRFGFFKRIFAFIEGFTVSEEMDYKDEFRWSATGIFLKLQV